MKRSVENAEHVGKQLLTINRNDRQLTLVDLGLFTPTAGQYFRDERRRRHSQYGGGHASSFQPCGQRFKGKNALVFYPEGSPTVAGALSQDMDISHRIEVCDTPAPSIVELGNYITIRHSSGVDHVSHQLTEPPNHLSQYLPRHTGGPPLRTSAVLKHGAGRDARTTIMLRNIPNKDGQPPSAQIVGASLGRPDCLFRLRRVSVGPGSRGPHEERLAQVQRVEGTEHRIERSVDVMVAARRSVYGAQMLPRTTNFGVTPAEARELHENQHRSDLKLVCLGLPGGCMMLSPFFWPVRFHVIVGGAEHIIYVIFSNTTNFGVTPEEARELHEKQKAYNAANATVGKDAVTQQDGGIWDGTPTKSNNLI
ncbi:hypothetical protein LB505_006241 [Fusarium chuoi]|nr:hypothetical protein LB505_006241 [Fusarium chuoi]